jgi:hypothetical protein
VKLAKEGEISGNLTWWRQNENQNGRTRGQRSTHPRSKLR